MAFIVPPASDASIRFWKSKLAIELADWHASPRGNRKLPELSRLRDDEMTGFIMMLIARIECDDYSETEEYARSTRVSYGLEE